MRLSCSPKSGFVEHLVPQMLYLQGIKGQSAIMLTKHQQEGESLSEQLVKNWSRLALINLL